MSFDERSHRGFQLIGPIFHAPNACAVGNGLAISLAQAYAFGTTQARTIGHQTYRIHLDAPGIYATTADATTFTSTGYVDVAKFRRYIPTHATHLLFDCWARVAPGAASSVVYAQLEATSGATVTSAEFQKVIEPAEGNAGLVYGSEVSRTDANRALYEHLISPWAGWATVQMSGWVPVGALDLGEQVIVKVRLKCVDADSESVAVNCAPIHAQAWWEVA